MAWGVWGQFNEAGLESVHLHLLHPGRQAGGIALAQSKHAMMEIAEGLISRDITIPYVLHACLRGGLLTAHCLNGQQHGPQPENAKYKLYLFPPSRALAQERPQSDTADFV